MLGLGVIKGYVWYEIIDWEVVMSGKFCLFYFFFE